MDLTTYVSELTTGLIGATAFAAAVRQTGQTSDAVRVLVPIAGHNAAAAEALSRLAPGLRR